MGDRIVLDNRQYSSGRAILGVAAPAVILNAAAPICAVVQTALLGQYVGTAALGAYGAVSVTAGFATRVFNFLVDGVSAKTGKSVGLRAWGELGGRVKMSLGFALGAGIIAACILSALIHPVSVDILKLTDEVQKEAEWYWWLRVGLVPILLLNMSLSGILQGFRHVRVAAGINTCQSLLEMAGSAVVLKYGIPIGGHTGLVSMGVVTMVTQILALIAGLSCILALPPLEANGQFSLWEDWFGGKKEENGVRQPLLDDAALCQHDSVASLHEQSPATNIVKKPARTSIDEATVGSMASTVFGASVEDHHGPALDVRIAVSANGTVQVATPHANGDSVHPPSLPLGSNVLGSHPIPEEDVEAHTVVEWAPEEEQPQDGETMLDFVRDGINMFIRSMILQSTFFATLVAASRLGTPSLAAHSVVNQLWVLISYAVDGFAAAGIVLGSRLAAQAHDPERATSAKKHLQRLIFRVLVAGLVSGMAAAATFAAGRDYIIATFTDDPEAAAVLRHGTWTVLVLSQPINGLVFVYDGLMYASQNFTFIRNYMVLGFILVFCPILTLEVFFWNALWGVWLANTAINVWRVGGAAYLIHHIFMHEFDAQLRSRSSSYQSIA